FKVRKKVIRKSKSKVEWVTMRKGVAYLFRYQQVSFQANSRYLEALAVVDDPTKAKHDLDRMTTRKQDTAGRGCSGFNPLARPDAELFQTVMDGDHCLRGFTNKTRGKGLGFFGDCAPKKWPFGQIGPRAVSEKARSAISRQPSASDQHSA